HQLESFPNEPRGLLFAQAEIEHSQGRVEFLIEVFVQAVFLNAELEVLLMILEIGFDHPLVAVDADALKDERVGPPAPLAVRIEMPLGASDGAVGEGCAGGKPDAAGTGVTLEEFAVRKVFELNRVMNNRAALPSALVGHVPMDSWPKPPVNEL